jgi:hypothetical protein
MVGGTAGVARARICFLHMREVLMKVRLGFVSNSSSSSFILDKSKLTPEQLESVYHHAEQAMARFGSAHPGVSDSFKSTELTDYNLGWAEAWNIKELENNQMVVWTIMDNFQMGYWLKIIGAEAAIVSEGDGYEYDDTW